jgi:hypothetical protein
MREPLLIFPSMGLSSSFSFASKFPYGPPHRTKESGIHLPASATFLLAPELVNESSESQDVYLTITYEYIPRSPPHSKP